MTPEERAAMRRQYPESRYLDGVKLLDALNAADAATADADRYLWRAQVAEAHYEALIEEFRDELAWEGYRTNRFMRERDAATADAERWRAQAGEVAAATIAWRALDLRIVRMQMADGEQVQVQTDWTQAELGLTQALDALAVTQLGVSDG